MEERIRDELPEDLRRTLDNEMVRRSQGHWVTLPEPLPMPLEVIKELVTQLTRQPLVRGERIQGAVIFNCGSREGKEAVRSLDGWGTTTARFGSRTTRNG